MENPPPYSPNGENPGYPPPQNPGYPPPQQKDHGGYPPQQQGYPPQQQGYPPQQQGYPPQQQGYPPQGQGYVQQPPGYSSHMSSNNTTVVVQSQPQVVSTVIPVVNDQMGLAIFACLCCCWPIGIIAIMKSSEARNRYTSGDYAGAVASAQSSRNLSYAAIICGLILIPLIIVLRVVVFAASTASNNNYN